MWVFRKDWECEAGRCSRCGREGQQDGGEVEGAAREVGAVARQPTADNSSRAQVVTVGVHLG